MRLVGKSIVVTGGGTGIGLELARQLVARGNRVAICGRRRAKIDAAQSAIPGLEGIACDLGAEGGVEALDEFVRSKFENIDMLVNNAAVQVQTTLLDGKAGSADLAHELMTNLGAPLRLAQLFMPMLLRRPEAAIVNMISLLGILPKANAPGYCASKAGLYAFTRSLELALAGSRVRAIAVFPPMVETPMTHGRGTDKMPVEAFVRAMIADIERGRRDIRVGQARTVLMLNRVLPGLAWWRTRRMSAGATMPLTD